MTVAYRQAEARVPLAGQEIAQLAALDHLQLIDQCRHQPSGRQRSRQGGALPCPLRTESRLAGRLCRLVERFAGIISNGIARDLFRTYARAQGSEAVCKTPRRPP